MGLYGCIPSWWTSNLYHVASMKMPDLKDIFSVRSNRHPSGQIYQHAIRSHAAWLMPYHAIPCHAMMLYLAMPYRAIVSNSGTCRWLVSIWEGRSWPPMSGLNRCLMLLSSSSLSSCTKSFSSSSSSSCKWENSQYLSKNFHLPMFGNI